MSVRYEIYTTRSALPYQPQDLVPTVNHIPFFKLFHPHTPNITPQYSAVKAFYKVLRFFDNTCDLYVIFVLSDMILYAKRRYLYPRLPAFLLDVDRRGPTHAVSWEEALSLIPHSDAGCRPGEGHREGPSTKSIQMPERPYPPRTARAGLHPTNSLDMSLYITITSSASKSPTPTSCIVPSTLESAGFPLIAS